MVHYSEERAREAAVKAQTFEAKAGVLSNLPLMHC